MNRLADDLTARGYLAADWRRVFTSIPRHAFLPARVWTDLVDPGVYQVLERASDPQAWWDLAYSDEPVVTQLDDGHDDGPGHPTSSASQPRMVTRMLAALDAQPGHRVLEIGTGTGYNAALLAARCGDEAVTSIEIDPQVAADAEKSLRSIGHYLEVLTADASAGHPQGAVFDRIIATASAAKVPAAWITQLLPGGRLLTPVLAGFGGGVLLQLTRHRKRPVACGPVVGDAAFMPLRSQRLPPTGPAARDGRPGRTGLDPRELTDRDTAFALGLALPGVRLTAQDEASEYRVWLTALDGSWATTSATAEADQGETFEVWQYGPRHLWTELEGAYTRYLAAGRPARTAFGLTVTVDSAGQATQQVWLGEPHRPW